MEVIEDAGIMLYILKMWCTYGYGITSLKPHEWEGEIDC